MKIRLHTLLFDPSIALTEWTICRNWNWRQNFKTYIMARLRRTAYLMIRSLLFNVFILVFRMAVKISAFVLKKSTAPGVSKKVPTTWKCLSIIFGKLPTPICTAHLLSALETEAWEPPNCHWLLESHRKILVRNLFFDAFIPFFVFRFSSVLATELRKYKNIA